MIRDRARVVRSGYDSLGSRYRDWSHRSPVRLHYVDRLLGLLGNEPDRLVLELGCGAGDPATRLLADHHHVVGVDLSHVQLALAHKAAPSARLVQADMAQFSVHVDSVDAVASFYAFGHVPPAEHRPLFGAIATWLVPGGVLVTSAPVSDHEIVERDWLGVPMFFGGIGETATRSAVEESGLVIESLRRVAEEECDGSTVEFLWLIARKPK